MPVEIPARKTPASKEQVIETLWKAWMGYFGAAPRKESIWVLVAQWGLETGWGASMWNWNFGNVKSKDGDGYDFQFYECGEEITQAEAQRWVAADPSLVKIVRTYTSKKGIPMASVTVKPKHWACRFRAFDDILEGATDYLALLVKRFTLAWPYVVDGDPVAFSHALKQQGYYTDDEAHYTKTLVGTYVAISKLAFDYDSLPALTEDEKERIGNLVSLTIYQSVGEYLDADDVVAEDEPNS